MGPYERKIVYAVAGLSLKAYFNFSPEDVVGGYRFVRPLFKIEDLARFLFEVGDTNIVSFYTHYFGNVEFDNVEYCHPLVYFRYGMFLQQ